MIDSFRGKYFYLSNFYPAEIKYDGLGFPTSENLFQSFKSMLNPLGLKKYTTCTPAEAKALGRKEELPPCWEEDKFAWMYRSVREKFVQHDDLRDKLLQTDTFICENNTWHDNEWGNCICLKCGVQGANKLGIILMFVREELR